MKQDYTTISTDVLIIGAGAGGMRAAIEASRKGAKAVILNKASFPGGSSCITHGYMQASFGWTPGDTKDTHFRDTIISSKYLCDQSLVKVLVDESPDRVFDMEEWGVLFTRIKKDRYEQVGGAGLSADRRVMVGGRHDDVLRVLYQAAVHYGAVLYDQIMATSLLKDTGGNVIGATAIDILTGHFKVFTAKATILANGPCGRLFKSTCNTRSATGDGFAMAYRSGAKLVNMEFMQFIPVAFIHPNFMKGVLIGEFGTYGNKVIVKNALGERFMSKYAPDTMEMSTRDICSRATYLEIMEGRGTPSGGILISANPDEIPELDIGPVRQGPMYKIIREIMGDDVANLKKPAEVAPAAIFFLGGIKINDKCETSLPGLYAAGEAETNVHGANRLAGNAVAEMQVFGRRAGYYAADYAAGVNTPKPDSQAINDEYRRVHAFFDAKSGFRPVQIHEEVQDIMSGKVNIVRDSDGLHEAIRKLEALNQEKIPHVSLASSSKRYNYEWVEAIEANNMVTISELIAKCALMRQESRGAHYRKDFPEMDDTNWLRESVAMRVNGSLQLSSEPVYTPYIAPEAN